MQFPAQSLLRGFSMFQLAARKLPKITLIDVGGSPRNENLTEIVPDDASGYMKFGTSTHGYEFKSDIPR